MPASQLLAVFRLQCPVAVVAVELVQGGRLEALPKARSQDGVLIGQNPGGCKLAGTVPAVHVVMIVTAAGGEGEAFQNLVLRLRVAAMRLRPRR